MRTFETYDELPGESLEYRKKTAIKANQILEPFKVHTLEGWVEGKSGDWLAKGVEGELYPINNEVFEKSYEKIKEKDDKSKSKNRRIME